MKVDIIVAPGAQKPEYTRPTDAGMDVRAFIEEDIILEPAERALIPTGNKVNLPDNLEMQVRPRSGLALKHGISIVNTPGTVDPGYQGDIGVILINLGEEPFTIKNGDRIAQVVFTKFERIETNEVTEFEASERGSEGFGSSGRA